MLRGSLEEMASRELCSQDRNESHTQFCKLMTQRIDDLDAHVYLSPAGLTADFLRFGIRRSAQVPIWPNLIRDLIIVSG